MRLQHKNIHSIKTYKCNSVKSVKSVKRGNTGLAYFVTGISKDEGKKKYSLFDSINGHTIKIDEDKIKDNQDILNNTVNIQSIFNMTDTGNYVVDDCVVEYDITESNNPRTIVYIDFTKNKIGTVSWRNDRVKWVALNHLRMLSDVTRYNNICYNKDTMKLDLKKYHIIGKGYERDVILENIVYDSERCEDENISNMEEIYESYKDKKNKEMRNIKESIDKLEWLVSRDKDNIENNTDNVTNVEYVEVNKHEYYELMLAILDDEDIVTIPKDVFDKLKFRLEKNLEVDMSLQRRVSLGIIELGKLGDKIVKAIVRINESDDKVRIQVIKNKSIDEIKDMYAEWRANKKYLTIKI